MLKVASVHNFIEGKSDDYAMHISGALQYQGPRIIMAVYQTLLFPGEGIQILTQQRSKSGYPLICFLKAFFNN